MKRFVAFLVIAAILGAAGFFFLGTLNVAPKLAGQAPSPVAVASAPAVERMAPRIAKTSARAQSTSTFDRAQIAFDTPSRMTIGKSREVKLLLNLNKTIEELQNELSKEFSSSGASIDAAPIMEANLSGGAFDIRAGSPVRQALRESENTTWDWSVIPRESGHHTLKLRLYAIVSAQGSSAPMEVKTFERDIPVDVAISEMIFSFVKENIQLVWLVLVVPIAGFLSRLFKAKPAV